MNEEVTYADVDEHKKHKMNESREDSDFGTSNRKTVVMLQLAETRRK
jgi:hypothetical protein